MVAVVRAAVAIVALAASALAFAQAPLERAVKAAYVYKFLAYVDWPAAAFDAPDAPFVIGVLGSDVIADEIRQIVAGRSVGERAVQVKRLREGESAAGLHVVFVGRAESARLHALARSVQGQPTLVVTESPGALNAGSAINLVVASDGRVRFEIALDAADRSGLRLSSRLLALAQTVRPGGP
ncbi:MAG TPA: YfiR family protein [Casimicrobiaceae bacterium]